MSRRRILSVLIVGVWLATVGWQVRREYFQPELARLADAALSLGPGVEFYSLRMSGRSVGQATSRLDTVPGGFVLEDFMALELPALGQTGTAVARTRVELDPSLVMRSFSFSLDSDVGRYAVAGSVVGDTLLEVEMNAGGSTETLTHRLAQPPVFAAVVPIRVAVGGELEVGSRMRMPVFDPSALSTRSVEVWILEHDTLLVADSTYLDEDTGRWIPARYDSVPAWRMAEVFGGVQVESWIDQNGRIIRASSPLGFSMERTEYELARQAQEEARHASGGTRDGDVILSTAIQSGADLSGIRAASEMRYLLHGVDLEGFALDGGRQELRGDTLVVRVEAQPSLDPGYSLPYKRMDLAAHLAPEPLIQSDDPRVRQRARTAAGGGGDPVSAAARLTMHLYRTLEKEITFSVPSALQVLEAGRGDCNEHAVLFVAMARALGIPARTAVGLTAVNGAFYYHAWPEVWLGRWVAADPTFGQFPADAGHIRFVNGGLAQQVEIVRLIGRLRIDVLSPVNADG